MTLKCLLRETGSLLPAACCGSVISGRFLHCLGRSYPRIFRYARHKGFRLEMATQRVHIRSRPECQSRVLHLVPPPWARSNRHLSSVVVLLVEWYGD